jgi:hypothetical protein
MIYGYLRVSSDEQDVNSQKQGVDAFAKDHNWTIDEYITDEGVSGGKDPSKRNLGKLTRLIGLDLTIPQIAEQFPEYTYEQVYDTILCDDTLNPLYRKHGQLKIRKNK